MEAKDLKDFSVRNRIGAETWETASISWEALQAIATDHEAHLESLRDTATFIANTIQRFTRVHSVRWRVKDTEHLLAKIVRKRADGEKKYSELTAENYHQLVTDLVGIRAIHLFKDDCFVIDEALRAEWVPIEGPVAYIRDGDENALTRQLKERGFEIKQHPAGYRSIHYVIGSQPKQRRVQAEVQIRTIFEEGWSEIDHNVRYPNFSDDELVGYFLAIFNRLAGSSDEMGSFVRGLATSQEELRKEVARLKSERDASVRDMEKAIAQLEHAKSKDEESQHSIATLRSELAKLKGPANRAGLGLVPKGLVESAGASVLDEALKRMNSVESAVIAADLRSNSALRGLLNLEISPSIKKSLL